jgi:hypothetical protein
MPGLPFSRRSLAASVAAAAAVLLAPSALAGGSLPCDADIDGDGSVAFTDLTLLLSDWGPCDPPCPSDIDGSGEVEFNDLLALLGAFGTICSSGEPTAVELAARPLADFPFASFDATYLETDPGAGRLLVAIDPSVTPDAIGVPVDIYVVEDRGAAGWAGNPSLADVRGLAQTVTLDGPGLAGGIVAIEGDIPGDLGLDFGIAYDLVVDVDRDGVLGTGDLIDGLDGPGFHVVGDTTEPGPLAVSTTIFSSGQPFGAQITRFPTEGGPYPLVVMSHGNGHSYTWYAYLQNHLASYGYVVTSHQNETQPGIETASLTTLNNTEFLIANRDTVASGALAGKIDPTQIIWIGHSRGGEGVVRAYDRIRDGVFTPQSFSLGDIKLVSSIAPTDFLGAGAASPERAVYHLVYGAADGDVSGNPGCAVCQSFSVFERATGERYATYLHAADHNDFNCCGFQDYCQGSSCPPQLGRDNVQTITKGMYLALIEAVVRGRVQAEDFLYRPWEDLRPIGAPASTVNHELQPDPTAAATNAFVIDDFQTGSSLALSSSGGAVSATVVARTEGRLDDNNTTFTATSSDAMNGMTRGRGNDQTRGTVFEWSGPATLEFEVVAAGRAFDARTWLSWRSAQSTRDGLNGAADDLDYSVTLIDGSGTESTIRLSSYGGGVQRPFARTGAGTGTGWQNEFETHRIRVADFGRDGRAIDLSDIVAVRFDFGGDAGSASGRIGFDDLMVIDR